jgi:CBS domain-containing protein
MDASEIMTREVIALSPEMPVEEATDRLLQYRIHGAPVVGPQRQLLGMLSFMDVARHAGEAMTVKDVMTPTPVVASEDTPVETVARLMLDEMVRRVPIVRGETVVGIISASDIVQLFLNLHEQPRRTMGQLSKGRR